MPGWAWFLVGAGIVGIAWFGLYVWVMREFGKNLLKW